MTCVLSDPGITRGITFGGQLLFVSGVDIIMYYGILYYTNITRFSNKANKQN